MEVETEKRTRHKPCPSQPPTSSSPFFSLEPVAHFLHAQLERERERAGERLGGGGGRREIDRLRQTNRLRETNRQTE